MPRKTKPTQSLASPVNNKQQTLLSHFSSSPSVSEKKAGSNRRRKTGNSSHRSLHDSEHDVEITDSLVPLRASRKRATVPNEEESSDSSDVGKIRFEARSSSVLSDRESSSEAESQPLSPSRPSKRKRLLHSDSEGNEADGSRPRIRASRRITKRDQAKETESHSESDVAGKRKSRLVKGKRPTSNDEDNEDDDILSGIDEDKIIDGRLRGHASQRSRFMQNLERLKRKKRGLTTSESEEEAPSEEDDIIPGASRDDADQEIDSGDNQNNGSEEELHDFVVEDEGEMQAAALPAMFSMTIHQDLIHHFKVVCQYLVHLAVTTPSARSRIAERLTKDEYFSVPLAITRRKLADIRDSIVSSVWRPAYKKALLTYPEFNLHDLDFAIPHCDACNLGGRLSTTVGRLSGPSYDRATFESFDSENSSDDSDEEHQRGPPEFNLGRFCARRTSVFHELSHWEYELFRGLSREVEELSHAGRGFVRIGYAGGAEPPEDVSDADQVMEWLDQRGIINAEWLKVKQMMSMATNLEADVKRGRGDD